MKCQACHCNDLGRLERLEEALSTIRNAVNITGGQVNPMWIIDIVDEALGEDQGEASR